MTITFDMISDLASQARDHATEVRRLEQLLGEHADALQSLHEGVTRLERKYAAQEYDGKNAAIREAQRQAVMDDDPILVDARASIAARGRARRQAQIERDFAERQYKVCTAALRAYGGNL